MELSTIIVDATYNYIIGNITVEEFNQQVEKWGTSGGNLIIQEYTAAEARAEAGK
ncbi:hypothetical protein D3C81_2299830 [compost metagenome]